MEEIGRLGFIAVDVKKRREILGNSGFDHRFGRIFLSIATFGAVVGADLSAQRDSIAARQHSRLAGTMIKVSNIFL
jgi:hypothetical protein